MLVQGCCPHRETVKEKGCHQNRRVIFLKEGASAYHTVCQPASPPGESSTFPFSTMNWCMIISVLIVVVLKVVGMTLFLLHFCPAGWDLHQGKCFLLSIFESPWNKSRSFCKEEGSTLAIVNTPEKLKFLQDIAGAEMYFIGLTYQPAEKRWRWINNYEFNGNVTNYRQNFNCATIGLTKTFDAAFCDINHRWICEKNAK
ncbi:C-type lectin domain family 5 member A isoform X2 [Loxodonta africana]|uniref:C-type lectin domain family 5 member A isoform X2 n=2 Tax=Elephantidae TaxID=9780 RepID=UPI0030D37C50